MITRLAVQRYKCFESLDLRLPPFCALIGPNNAGKTTVLEALQNLSEVTQRDLSDVFAGPWDVDSLAWAGSPERSVRFSIEGETSEGPFAYDLEIGKREGKPVAVAERVNCGGAVFARTSKAPDKVSGTDRFFPPGWALIRRDVGILRESVKVAAPADLVAGIRRYEFRRALLERPCPIETGQSGHLDSSGYGLPAVLDWRKAERLDSFVAIQRALCEEFGDVAEIVLRRKVQSIADDRTCPLRELDRSAGGARKTWTYLEFRLGNGWVIPAPLASDGVLLYLAYLTLLFSDSPPSVLLVEEPENGNHAKRLGKVVDLLRRISTGAGGARPAQVVITTHSPFVLDFLRPEEVFVVTRGEDGRSTIRPMTEVEHLRDRMVDFSLGELWYNVGEESMFGRASPRRKTGKQR